MGVRRNLEVALVCCAAAFAILQTTRAWGACSTGAKCCPADSFCGKVQCGSNGDTESCNCCRRNGGTYECVLGPCTNHTPPGTNP
jgi:hypothetical protein